MIKSFRHKGLALLFNTGKALAIPPQLASRIRTRLAVLHQARALADVNVAGYRLHPLKGDQAGRWSIDVNGPWRITFEWGKMAMSTTRISNSTIEIPAAAEPGFAPVHPGEVLREALSEGLHLSVSETARRIGVSRQMLHDILAGRRAVTAEMALRFERLGAAAAGLLLRLQDDYDLAQARVRLADQLAAIEPARDTLAA